MERIPGKVDAVGEVEIGDLVKCLTLLQVTEPDYAIAYAHLIIALPSMAMRFPGPAIYTAVAAGPSPLGQGLKPFPLYPAV